MFSKLQTKFYYYHIFLVLLILKYTIFCILELRQYLYISSPNIPKDLQGYITQEVYNRLARQEMKYFLYGFYESFAHCVIFILTFLMGLLPRAWNAFGRWCDRRTSLSRFIGPDKIMTRSLIFYFMHCLLRALIFFPLFSMPREWATRGMADDPSKLSKWGTKYLLNTTGFFSVIFDIVFAFVLQRTRNGALWLPTVIMSAFLIFSDIFNNLIIPAFIPVIFELTGEMSKMDPAFLDPIIAMAKKFKFPANRIVLMANWRNAAITGAGRYATMMVGTGLKIFLEFTDTEILALVGHELGHWVLNHVPYQVLLEVVLYTCYTTVVVYLIRNKAFYKSFDIGTDPQIPFGVGLILATGVFQLFKFFTQPLENYVSQICEYQADAFAVSIGHGKELIKAIPKFHALGNALAEPIYGIFLYTHPVYSARIRALVENVSSSRR